MPEIGRTDKNSFPISSLGRPVHGFGGVVRGDAERASFGVYDLLSMVNKITYAVTKSLQFP